MPAHCISIVHILLIMVYLLCRYCTQIVQALHTHCIHKVQCAVYIVRCALVLYTMYSTSYILYSILYTLHFKIYGVHSTLHDNKFNNILQESKIFFLRWQMAAKNVLCSGSHQRSKTLNGRFGSSFICMWRIQNNNNYQKIFRQIHLELV